MRAAFAVITAIYGVLVLAAALTLPDRVPLHWGMNGVDSWGSRTAAVATFAAFGAGIVALFAGLIALINRIPLDSPWSNLPNKEWWTARPERQARYRATVSRHMWAMGIATMALFCVAVALTMGAARDDRARLPGGDAAMVLIVAAYLAVTIWLVVRMRRGLRPGAAP